MIQHKELIELMKSHDWFYEFSDDQRTWRKGSAERTELVTRLRKVPGHELVELLKLVPEELRTEFFLDLQKRVHYKGLQ